MEENGDWHARDETGGISFLEREVHESWDAEHKVEDFELKVFG